VARADAMVPPGHARVPEVGAMVLPEHAKVVAADATGQPQGAMPPPGHARAAGADAKFAAATRLRPCSHPP